MHWYSADLHAYHANIIRLSKRPFASVEEMNAALLANFQARVKAEDDLWVLGDFAHWRAPEAEIRAFFEQIPGRKHLVPDNHDNERILDLPWASVRPLVEMADGNTQVVLCHYSMITWNGARKRNSIQLFGHVHQNWHGSRNSVNVGVDVWDFGPVGIKAIRRRARSLPWNPLWSTLEPDAEL